MPEGLIVHTALRGSFSIGRLALHALGPWAERRWWPTSKMAGALPIRPASFTQNETTPLLTFNRGACSLRFALEQENRSPYHVDMLSSAFEVVVEAVTVASFEIGPRGWVKSTASIVFRVEHAMTSHEMERLSFALERARTEKREAAPETQVLMNRLFRTKHVDHHDDAPVCVPMRPYIL